MRTEVRSPELAMAANRLPLMLTRGTMSFAGVVTAQLIAQAVAAVQGSPASQSRDCSTIVKTVQPRRHAMSNDFQIVFHNIDQSDAITDNVNKRIEKLRRFSSDIMGGRVVLDSPHNHQHKGKVYAVTLEIRTPNREVIVNQEQHDNPAHEDLYVAIRDAFNAAERQLKSVDKKHRKTPLHEIEAQVQAQQDAEELEMDDDGSEQARVSV
jgi:ribosomal subunit interface protein